MANNTSSKQFTCPMHPEVKSEKSGDCPECGMKLIPKEEAQTQNLGDKGESFKPTTLASYLPLFIIIGLITLVTLAVAVKDIQIGRFTAVALMSNFMAGFFLVFAGFKFLDLKGFMEGYSTYDLLAKRIPQYGYVYPFIELTLGLAYITRFDPTLTNSVTLVVMLFSSLGVILELAKKRKIQCYCLGTVLKVPLTNVTIIEDLGMALMALIMLV